MQALYNVLAVYFNWTNVAGPKQFFGETHGTQPLNNLQLYYQDIQYGTDNQTPETITLADGTTVSKTFEDLLIMTSADLKKIAKEEP